MKCQRCKKEMPVFESGKGMNPVRCTLWTSHRTGEEYCWECWTPEDGEIISLKELNERRKMGS